MNKTDKELTTEIVITILGKEPRILCEKPANIAIRDISLNDVLNAITTVHATLKTLEREDIE